MQSRSVWGSRSLALAVHLNVTEHVLGVQSNGTRRLRSLGSHSSMNALSCRKSLGTRSGCTPYSVIMSRHQAMRSLCISPSPTGASQSSLIVLSRPRIDAVQTDAQDGPTYVSGRYEFMCAISLIDGVESPRFLAMRSEVTGPSECLGSETTRWVSRSKCRIFASQCAAK